LKFDDSTLPEKVLVNSALGEYTTAKGAKKMQRKGRERIQIPVYRSVGILVLLFLLCTNNIYGQGGDGNEIEIIHADLYGFERNGEKFQQLTNNVVVRQGNVFLYCDSALKNDTRNVMDAFGNVKLQQGDSFTVTGDYLHYDGNTRLATLKQNVILRQTDFTLKTEELDYDTKTRNGYYPVHGVLVNKENTLTSETGYYSESTKWSYFKKNVVLVNKDYIIHCDTLKYNNRTSVAYFPGFTTITKIQDTTTITCYNGWYDRENGNSRFSDRVKITAPRQVLFCDSMEWNNEKERGEAFRNIYLVDTSNKLTVNGDYGFYDRKNQLTKVSDKAIASQQMDKDTLHIHADTLYYYSDTAGGTRIYGYHKVKIFKPGMQSLSDSIYYSYRDSVMYCYIKPVIWFDSTQLTADTIIIRFRNKKADQLQMRANSFIISKEDSLRFNQIRGKNVNGFFKDNNLSLVKVFKDGECVYYVRNEAKAYIGVNKIKCENMDIYLDSNQVSSVNYKANPEGTLYPILDLSPKELQLKGFQWKEALRPKSREELIH
jgi:lipopolysaccharide export system protein LptA